MNEIENLKLSEIAVSVNRANETVQPKQRRIVENRLIKRIQHIHTIVATGAGLSGVVAAVGLHMLVQPVSSTALGIFLLFFF